MKFTITALITSCLLFSSCKTIESKIDLAKAPSTINSVVPSAVRFGVNKQPKAAPYLAALATVINTFALGKDLSPAALQQAIAAAKVKELQTAEAQDIATLALVLYKTYYSDALTKKVATVENLAPILTALADSINAGLSPVAQ